MGMWRVKKRKFLRNKRGQIIGRPGDTFDADNADALACPSAVEMVAVHEDVHPMGSIPERGRVDDDEPPPLEETRTRGLADPYASIDPEWPEE